MASKNILRFFIEFPFKYNSSNLKFNSRNTSKSSIWLPLKSKIFKFGTNNFFNSDISDKLLLLKFKFSKLGNCLLQKYENSDLSFNLFFKSNTFAFLSNFSILLTYFIFENDFFEN